MSVSGRRIFGAGTAGVPACPRRKGPIQSGSEQYCWL